MSVFADNMFTCFVYADRTVARPRAGVAAKPSGMRAVPAVRDPANPNANQVGEVSSSVNMCISGLVLLNEASKQAINNKS